MNVLHWIVSDGGEGFFSATMRLGLPVMFAALGGIFSERSGVTNVGMEGMMLFGAFAAFAVGGLTSSLTLAVLAAVAAGAILALVLGLLTITLPSDQVVAGIALTLMCLGLTSYLNALLGTDTAPPTIGTTAVPGLDRIPVIGPLLFEQSWLGYLALVLAGVTWFVFRRTAWGMELIACGEHPEAAETLGVSVVRNRYLALVVSGVLAALGGAFLTLVESPSFLNGLTNGRGYVALALLVLGMRSPLGVVAAALLFGAADAGQLRIQVASPSVPVHLMLMAPYVITIIAMVFVRRNRPPAALGIPFRRQGAQS
jgi:ABC-type uncharacterized transport system permease subunit